MNQSQAIRAALGEELIPATTVMTPYQLNVLTASQMQDSPVYKDPTRDDWLNIYRIHMDHEGDRGHPGIEEFRVRFILDGRDDALYLWTGFLIHEAVLVGMGVPSGEAVYGYMKPVDASHVELSMVQSFALQSVNDDFVRRVVAKLRNVVRVIT